LIRSIVKQILAFIIFYSGLIKVLRLLGKNYTKILLYHSIDETENIFIRGTRIWTSPDKFNKHLKYLTAKYHIISLKDFIEFLNKGKPLKRSVILTLDDGFADNYSVAFPYLKKYKAPATILLTTECIENKKPIWIQELNYLFNTIGVEPIRDIVVSLSRKLNIDKIIGNRFSKTVLRKSVEEYFRYSLNLRQREKMMAAVYRKFNLPRRNIFSENKIFLNWKQIKIMCADGLTIGNHGASHTPLSCLSARQQYQEIKRSKRLIGNKIGTEFIPFSYPFGGLQDFNTLSERLIKQEGHSCILTAEPKLNHSQSSKYRLGRIAIENIPVYLLAFEMEKGVLKKLIRKSKNPFREKNECKREKANSGNRCASFRHDLGR
jgi:peptidoglycan/xylan/chitin deacetylase (PgdA/CDA1 family)